MSTDTATGAEGTPRENNAGRGGRGGRGWHRNRGRNRQVAATFASTFKGKIPEMEGHTFCTSDEGAKPTDFKKTMKQFETFCSSKFKEYYADFGPFLENLKMPVIPLPRSPTAEEAAHPMAATIAEAQIKDYVTRQNKQTQSGRTFCAYALQQCSPAIITKLENRPEYKAKRDEGDCTWMMAQIRDICYDVDVTKSVFISLEEATMNFSNFKQGSLTLSDYYDEFKARLAVLEENGGSFGVDPGRLEATLELPWCPSAPVEPTRPFPPPKKPKIVGKTSKAAQSSTRIPSFTKKEPSNPSTDPNPYGVLGSFDEDLSDPEDFGDMMEHGEFLIAHQAHTAVVRKICRDHSLALKFLMGSHARYENLRIELQNKNNAGEYAYPRDLVHCHARLEKYVPMVASPPSGGGSSSHNHTVARLPAAGSDELSFAQTGTPVPGTDGRVFTHITCHGCNLTGHYRNLCPTGNASFPAERVSTPGGTRD